ncbi:cold-shock protein [Paracoccus aminophilus]|uniref:Cold shock protein, CspA family n=1 Tax=Paracoccus aminophilus JCM 7686 TaxID=1367847 RepID=S5Y946_PARAH|nr:cold shock domain-containing protein [Paracoccus aminophilus]AGT07878.1 cold shock protein, CspA family [Paracoccus aminophilus JCM 7686]
MNDNGGLKRPVTGVIKWFDTARGFGFLSVIDEDGCDVLLHANVLRNFGQSSVADGSKVEVIAQETTRGMQAIEVLSIEPPATGAMPPIADLSSTFVEDVERLPLLPARVKWFDKGKGFGFANVFGQKGDIFLHIEVLRHCGFADLAVGEAIAIRIVDGRRGLMAAQILAWDRVLEEEKPAAGAVPLLLKPRLVAGVL